MLDAEENPGHQIIVIVVLRCPPNMVIFWRLMFARCFPHASLDADAELAETVWGLASSQKDGDVFQRVGYFIGNTDCIPWFRCTAQRIITI